MLLKGEGGEGGVQDEEGGAYCFESTGWSAQARYAPTLPETQRISYQQMAVL